MPEIKINKKHPAFRLIERLVKAAIKQAIALEAEWSITKIPFEEKWEVQQLNPSVEDSFGLQISDIEVDFDLAEDDDVESLTYLYVTFIATGKLAAVLSEHGVKPLIEIDVSNPCIKTVAQLSVPRVFCGFRSDLPCF